MIEPDGIFVLKFDDFILPLILEVHRYPDSGRIAQQLNKHGYGIHIGSLNSKYGVAVSPIILSVHEHEHSMLSVQKRLSEAKGFESFEQGYIFNTVEQFKTDMTTGWKYACMKPALLFEN